MPATDFLADVDAGKWTGLQRASLPGTMRCLRSGLAAVDGFLDGGLGFGELCEWGVPFGLGGRRVLIGFLAQATQQAEWVLWAHHRPGLCVYPPAWAAAGLDLSYVRFAETQQATQELRAAFLEPFFKIIVLDSPNKLTKDDLAFLARNARYHERLIIILRDYTLSSQHGNVWARLRLNCHFDPEGEHYHLQVVRGLSPRHLAFRLEGRGSC